MELGANTLIDAISKMRAHTDAAKICLTSINGEALARDLANQLTNKYKSAEYHEHLQFMGVTIVGNEEVETDHAFFFATVEDMNEFLQSIRELKSEGMDWKDIVRWFECTMRRVWK